MQAPGARQAHRGRHPERSHGRACAREQNTPTICRSIARPRSTLARASHSTARTLADWVGKAAFLLRPIHERLFERLKSSGKLFADETTGRCSIPAGAARRRASSFAYARDDRPWGGADPPGVAYLYAPDRKAEQPIRHLAGFVGVMQVDGYADTARWPRRTP